MTTKWPMVPLSELLTQDTAYITDLEPKDYPRISVKWWGEGAVAKGRVNGTQVRMERHQLAKEGQVIVSEIWAKHGSIGIIPKSAEGALITSHFFLFDMDQQRVMRAYLDYLFRANYLIPQMQGDSKGTTSYASVRPHTFLKAVIPLPNMPEQRRIVARIEELAGKIAEAKRLRAESAYETTALQGSFEVKLFEKASWSTYPLGRLVGPENFQNGKSPKVVDYETSVRCLRLSCLQSGVIDATDSKPVDMEPTEAFHFQVQAGQVFVSRGNGSKELVGRAGCVNRTVPGTIFPDLFIKVPLNDRDFLPEFFVAYWNNPRMRRVIEEAAKTGAGIWKVNQSHLASIRVPKPPIEEQKQAVRAITDFSNRVRCIQAEHATLASELDALLSSILDKAFRGEL